MAYTHHSPIPSPSVQSGQVFDVQAYAHQTRQYQHYRPSPGPSPQPSPRPSPQPSPQPYIYQQVNRPPPSPHYNQAFSFPPRSPQPSIQQSYRPPPSPQPIFPLPQGYTPPTHIPPSLQARVKTPAPLEQTTASPRPHYAYLPQQNVITSVSTPSPSRVASPSRPLPPPKRTRPESTSPAPRIQIPTSSFTENTLYRQPSAIAASPLITSPGPDPLVTHQSQVQAPVHRPSYSVGSASPPKPVSSFSPPIPVQIPGQSPIQTPIQLPSHRSESPNRGRPLPTPTPRTPSPTKGIQPPIVPRSVTDNTPQWQLQQQPLPAAIRSATEINPPPSNARENTFPGPIHRPTSSMDITGSSSHTSSIKEIALPPATTPGQSFVPYWKRNLEGGPRAHGVQRRETVAGGSSRISVTVETPRSDANSFSSSNPPTSSSPVKPPSRHEIKPGTGVTRRPTSSFDFGTRSTHGPQPEPQSEPQPRANGTTELNDLPTAHGTIPRQPPMTSTLSQTPSAFSLHQRRGAETTRSNSGPDLRSRSNFNVQPRSPNQTNRDQFGSGDSTVHTPTVASTPGSGSLNRSIVPPKPVRSQTYDPKPPAHGEESFNSTPKQHRNPPSPNKLSSGKGVERPLARTPSPQYGILDMPRSRFSQRVEAKTEALNGLRSRGSSPVRSESPAKGIPTVSPFARSESPTRHPSPTRSHGLPRPTPMTPNPPSANGSPFPPALKRSSVTPQSVTLQMATMGIGDDRDRGRPLDQHRVQPAQPQQERARQNGITKSESGWPSNLPRLPRTPATSQHPNSTTSSVNGTHGVTPTLATGNRAGSHSRPSASTSSFGRNPDRHNGIPPSHSNPKSNPREDERRSVAGLDLDDAPPPSLRRSPSPASSVASSNFSSFSAAMESYRGGVSESQFSASPRDSHKRTESVPARQSTEPVKTGHGHTHSQSQSQSRAGARQQTMPSRPQVRSQPQPTPSQPYENGFPSRSRSPVRQQQHRPPPQSPRRQPVSPVTVDTTPTRHQPRSPIEPTVRTPQAQSPRRKKISFPANPDSDSDDGINGPRIAVTVADDGGPGPKISISGTDDIPNISINVGGSDDDYGGGPDINVDSGGPSINVNGGRKSVAELPTIRRGGGLSCGGCGGMIVGRVVSAMGARWHPGCFRCCVCHELLQNLSSYEMDGRSFCHLDYHEVGPAFILSLVARINTVPSC